MYMVWAAAGVVSTGGLAALLLTKKGGKKMEQNHKIVSQEEWLAARGKYLSKEKEFTRLRDELSRQVARVAPCCLIISMVAWCILRIAT
jgi:hypothetical protein